MRLPEWFDKCVLCGEDTIKKEEKNGYVVKCSSKKCRYAAWMDKSYYSEEDLKNETTKK